jgi:integrase
MFTYANGRPIRPEYLTHRFRQICQELGLPPIRLHDLRHCAATLALASHADLKVIQQMLGVTRSQRPLRRPAQQTMLNFRGPRPGCDARAVARQGSGRG